MDFDPLVEKLARVMRPNLFTGKPDDHVDSATVYERNMLRQYARAVLASGLVVPNETGEQ